MYNVKEKFLRILVILNLSYIKSVATSQLGGEQQSSCNRAVGIAKLVNDIKVEEDFKDL